MDNMKLCESLSISECEVSDVLARMAKTTEESKGINCGGCGFNTCEQMVAAIILGMRTTEDCVCNPCNPSLKQDTLPYKPKQDMLDKMNNLLTLIDLKEDESLQLIGSVSKLLSELKVSRKRVNDAIHILTS